MLLVHSLYGMGLTVSKYKEYARQPAGSDKKSSVARIEQGACGRSAYAPGNAEPLPRGSIMAPGSGSGTLLVTEVAGRAGSRTEVSGAFMSLAL